jgi:trk system potassium uptake protein TrkH
MALVDRFESSNPAYPVGMFDSTAFLFESFSAFGTVGLSQGVTPYLTSGSKIILSMLMLFGRIGPMTMISVFSESMNQADKLHFDYVEAVLPIG